MASLFQRDRKWFVSGVPENQLYVTGFEVLNRITSEAISDLQGINVTCLRDVNVHQLEPVFLEETLPLIQLYSIDVLNTVRKPTVPELV